MITLHFRYFFLQVHDKNQTKFLVHLLGMVDSVKVLLLPVFV
jgi:hypothetical protein